MTERCANRGFTLVELLVALALLSIVMLALGTAMRSFAQTEVRIDQHMQRDEEFRVAVNFLRTILAEMSPLAVRTAPGAPKRIAFAGAGDQLDWIGVMPARQGAGGLYRFRLFVRSGTDAPAALILDFAPLTNFDSPLDSGTPKSRVMVDGVSGVAFRYEDTTAPEAAWLSAWPYPDRLPRRVGLQIRTSAQTWPELIVTVLPAVGPGVSSRAGGGSGPIIGPF